MAHAIGGRSELSTTSASCSTASGLDSRSIAQMPKGRPRVHLDLILLYRAQPMVHHRSPFQPLICRDLP